MPASLVYSIATSVDGFVARKDGSFDFFQMEGDHAADFVESLASFDTALMGRKTYEAGLKWGVSNPFPNMQTHVFSKNGFESADPNILVSEDAVAQTKKLKSESDRRIFLSGAGSVAKELFDHELIDEIHLKVNPVIVGEGIPLTEMTNEDVNLELISSKQYSNGVMLLKYKIKF